MRQNLWTKNFSLIIIATVLGAVGAVASGYALSLLVFDETGSTMASAFVMAIRIVPGFLMPLVASPWLDRLPRKPFVVVGDALNGVLYGLMGLYLLFQPFTYTGYLVLSLILAVLNTLDSMAYEALYPNLIPKGCEQKGYTVAAMVYPTVTMVMMPLSALLFDAIGVAAMLLIQCGLSLLAASVESRIRIREVRRLDEKRFSLKLWLNDLKAAFAYLRAERGVGAIYTYMAVTNGVGTAYSPILMAFFRTAPGLSMAMYAFFSVAEFAGRSLGGVLHYHVEIPPKKRFSFAFLVYQIYETMDMLLLWLPYPLMLVSRAVCGFLGINSATMREAAVQSHLPDELRAKLNAFSSMLISGAGCLFALVLGALGEVMDYRICVTACGALCCLVCWLTIWRQRRAVKKVYED